MSFLDHLEALRWHLIRTIASVLVFTIMAFMNKTFIYGTVFLGPARPNFWTYKQLCFIAARFHIDGLCVKMMDFTLINTAMAGQFTQHILMSITVGMVLAFPYGVWEFWRFLRPALTYREKRYTRGLVSSSSILFAIGVVFGYYFITPITIQFLAGYSLDPSIKNTIVIGDYIDLVTMTTLSIAMVFELPIVVYFLSWGGILTPKVMRSYRKQAVVVIFILAAIITPSTDMFTQTAVSVPFLLLYEASIFVSMVVERRKKKKQQDEDSYSE